MAVGRRSQCDLCVRRLSLGVDQRGTLSDDACTPTCKPKGEGYGRNYGAISRNRRPRATHAGKKRGSTSPLTW